MARPALRRIDPSLDLSEHLVELERLPQPFDPTTVFSTRTPLEIEVGSGKGLFVVGASAERPEHSFLGCEIARNYARLCARGWSAPDEPMP